MSTPHKATKRQWENIALRAKVNEEEGELACAFSTDSVLCEIADRVAALEEDDHKQRLVALHHEQRIAALEAAATTQPAPDHFPGASEADDTDGWIRSRLPTEADADGDGDVYIKCKAIYHDRLAWGWRGGGAACINYKQIVPFQPWKPMSGKS